MHHSPFFTLKSDPASWFRTRRRVWINLESEEIITVVSSVNPSSDRSLFYPTIKNNGFCWVAAIEHNRRGYFVGRDARTVLFGVSDTILGTNSRAFIVAVK